MVALQAMAGAWVALWLLVQMAEFEAVQSGKGFAIVRGIRGGYKMYYGQSNSMTNPALSKFYATRSAIIDDAYFEITASSAPMAYTTIPELCVDFTFTI